MANVSFILDEAASLGPNMSCLDDAIDKYRGYGIRLILVYQSLAQLKKCFPNDQDQTVLANTSQVFFGVNDSSAEYISNRLGDQTIVVSSGGSGSSSSNQFSEGRMSDSSSESSSTNNNWNQMGRRLLKPDEIMALDERIAITFVPGLRPIRTRLERYYEKSVGSPRLARLKTLAASILVFVVGTILCFGSSVLVLEAIRNG